MMKDRFKSAKDLHFDRMFETRSAAWEQAGLAVNVSQRAVRRARRQAIVLVPLLIAVLVVYGNRQQIFGVGPHSAWNTWIRWATVLALLALGWTLARDIGRAAGPTFFRRMDPATAGTVGFLIRLVTIVIVLIVALRIAAVDTGSLVAGSAFSAIVLGLAAQQTLGNLFAGLVLLTARPFRVGERIRLQAGALGGVLEGIVSSLGLLYTTLARGEDRIMIPNNGVLSAVVVPLKEPDSVDVKVRLRSGVRPSQVQTLLDDRISIPTRSPAAVLLEEIDGDDVVVRVRATPERAKDGAQLADEIITTLASVTEEHAAIAGGWQQRPEDEEAATASGDPARRGRRDVRGGREGDSLGRRRAGDSPGRAGDSPVSRRPAEAYPDSAGGTLGPAAARLGSGDGEDGAGEGELGGDERLNAADGLLGPAAARIDPERPREPRIRRETGPRPRGKR